MVLNKSKKTTVHSDQKVMIPQGQLLLVYMYLAAKGQFLILTQIKLMNELPTLLKTPCRGSTV